jgi:hypothetical protein
LLPADLVSCGFFRGGWPAGGFGVLLPGAGFADDVAGLAAAADLAAVVVGLAVAGFAAVDGLPTVDGLPEVTDLAEVSLLTAAGLAGAAGGGAVPPVAGVAPGTVGYRLNSTYC